MWEEFSSIKQRNKQTNKGEKKEGKKEVNMNKETKDVYCPVTAAYTA
jgi:hypothetical protein